MNVLNLLIKKKNVVGIEISDDAIRIAYFHIIKKNKKELVLIEEKLEDNIVSEGIITNKELFHKKLKSIWSKRKIKSNYAIVSILENKIYSHIFPFPKTENVSQLKEAISLAINFEIPINKESAYVGSENAGDSNVINEILISAIPKNIADDYISTLNSVGIKILALESHLSSLARSIKSKFGQAILITKINPKDYTIFILKDKSIRFSRTISKSFIQKNDFLINEIHNIKTWFEFEKKIPISEIELSKTIVVDDYLKYLEQNNITLESQPKWLIAIGATIRGEIEEGKDKQISLLPVGTTEAYAYQNITIFISMLRNIIIGISIFFLIAFLLTYFFILNLSKINNTTNSNISSFTYTDIKEKENYINNVNLLISGSKEIISSTANWSILLDEINSCIIDGILVSNFSVTSINEKIYIVGISKDRTILNQFKKLLQESSYIDKVELPITNLEQKNDIPFSISFNLKDPNMLYNK